MVDEAWRGLAAAFVRISLETIVVMPNHIHAIIFLSPEGPNGNPTLGQVVHRFKSVTTTRYSKGVHLHEWQPYDRTLWQPRFFDHIIRDAIDLDRCRRYIAANPANWNSDRDREPAHFQDSGE
jgi:REP element-mobilizing transposase RayT